MDVNELFPESQFLKSEDVENAGGELELTIASVGYKDYEKDGKVDRKGLLAFLESKKTTGLQRHELPNNCRHVRR